METDELDLHRCLEEARAFHGGLCGGAIMGTRMAIAGCQAIGITDPRGKDGKNLIVYVETDRCPADGILATTGCHPGKRNMKILDYGKMAATFINLKTGKAVRVNAKNREGDRKVLREEIENAPDTEDRLTMPAEDLFEIREVRVELKPQDMPGKPIQIVTCSACNERIMDMREIYREGRVLCRPCADNLFYYSPIEQDPSD